MADHHDAALIVRRVRKPTLAARERFGEPRLYENFEALAAGAPS